MHIDLYDYSSLQEAASRIGEYFFDSHVFVFPTDTIYGLGGRADSTDVIDRVFQIKGRERSKPLSVLVSDMDMLTQITAPTDRHVRFLQTLFPAKVSVILPKTATLPDELVHHEPDRGLAVRIPDDPFLCEIISYTQVPLIGTSANRSGDHPPYTRTQLDDTWNSFPEKPDGIIYSKDQYSPQPSTIIDLRGSAPILLREGAVPNSVIYRTWDYIDHFADEPE